MTVDLGGWHTASVVTYRSLNDVVQQQGNFPATAEYTSEGGSTLNLNFGPWAVAVNPDENNSDCLTMEIPVTGGSFSYTDSSNLVSDYAVPETTILITVELNFVPKPEQATLHQLKAANTGVTVQGFLPQDPFTGIAQAVFEQLVQEWFDTSAAAFELVLASVDFNADYDNEGLTWLKPSYAGYAFAQPVAEGRTPTLDNSVFAILTLIDGEEPSNDLSNFIPQDSIPQDADGNFLNDASFLLAPNKYLEHSVWGGMGAIFEDITQNDLKKNFAIESDGTKLTNTKRLKMHKIEVESGLDSPKVEPKNFSISFDDTFMKVEFVRASYVPKPGITVHIEYSAETSISYDKKLGVLVPLTTNQTSTGSVDVSTEWVIADVFAGVAGLVLLVVGALAGVAATVDAGEIVDEGEAELGEAQNNLDPENQEEVDQQFTQRQKIARKFYETIHANPDNFMARAMVLSGICVTLGIAVEIFTGIQAAAMATAEADYSGDDAVFKVDNLISAAVADTIVWPEEVGTFTTSSARIYGAFQFGLDLS